ncbi:MAG TPA: right-handed parallel beta-helix repeat-containing protein [Kofleriaceae bacterium]|nr:right-handed parallel beta-helix repeat-containing protein [Kofleriaceae bacterium]
MKRILFATLALAACSKDNPYYCENAPDHNCMATDTPDAPVSTGCTASTECTSESSPVCGDDHACRACELHSECVSAACLPSGACGSDVTVAYASTAGNDANPCTNEQPCRTIGAAVATGKPYVKLAGSFDEAVSLSGANVHILADAGTTLTRTASSGPVLTLQGTSNVAIEGLIIRDGLGNTGDGIRVPSGEAVKLALDHVSVIDNSGVGVNVLGGTLKMTSCTVSGNKTGGAIIMAAIDITNSLFVANGASTSTTGGLTMTPSGSQNAFRFNTVADNVSSSSTLALRGINCAIPMTISSTIVSGNLASTYCMFDYSLLASPTGTNISGDPKFKATDATNPLAADYFRIQASSDAVDHAEPGAAMSTDIDGEPRVGAKDIGADEAQ